MKAYIITGSSKGIGFSIATHVLHKGYTVLGISRSINNELVDIAKKNNAVLVQMVKDLSDIHHMMNIVKEFIQNLDEQYESITLINNAGTIQPISLIEDFCMEEVEKAIALNITAPIMISSNFIKETKNRTYNKYIVNISSGVAHRPIVGWGVYGATKAALDSLTLSIAKEQHDKLKVISFYPGKVDTSMQESIRNSDEKIFSFVPYFQEAKDNGDLLKPYEVAAKLINFLEEDQFNSGEIYDIRNL